MCSSVVFNLFSISITTIHTFGGHVKSRHAEGFTLLGIRSLDDSIREVPVNDA
jgi:hypothetical protein